MRKTDNLSNPVNIKEIKSVTDNLSKQRAPRPDAFTGKFYQTFKEKTIPILYNLFQYPKAKDSFLMYEATIILMPKPDKSSIRKLHSNISYEHSRWKNSQQNLISNEMQQCTQRII